MGVIEEAYLLLSRLTRVPVGAIVAGLFRIYWLMNTVSEIDVRTLAWAYSLEAWAPEIYAVGAKRACNLSRVGRATLGANVEGFHEGNVIWQA